MFTYQLSSYPGELFNRGFITYILRIRKANHDYKHKSVLILKFYKIATVKPKFARCVIFATFEKLICRLDPLKGSHRNWRYSLKFSIGSYEEINLLQ